MQHASAHHKFASFSHKFRILDRLLASVVAALGTPHCGPAARDAALTVVEALLRHQEEAAAEAAEAAEAADAAEASDAADAMAEDDVPAASAKTDDNAAEAEAAGDEDAAEFAEVLAPHAAALLVALRSVVLAATGGSGGKVRQAVGLTSYSRF